MMASIHDSLSFMADEEELLLLLGRIMMDDVAAVVDIVGSD